VLKNAADDDHRVRPHDVNHRVSSESCEVVRADDGIVVPPPHIIHTRFELDEIVHLRSTLDRPFHVANDATERKSSLGIAARQLLESLQHPVLIETAVAKIRFGVVSKLELPTLLGGRRINPYPSQTSQMIMMLRRIYDVNRLVATLEPVLYEWQQYAVLFVVAVKKRADMAYFAELRAGKGNWRQGLLHGVYLALLWIAREPGRPSACFAPWQPRQRRLVSTALVNSMHLSKPNVYQTLVLVWRHSRRGLGSCRRLMTPSEEASIDTFVQLVSHHFSGLIAIVRSQDTQVSGFENREER
jgi:hypothetical protein